MNMKTALGLVLLMLLCGCIYEKPLIEEAVVPVDQSLTGLWREILKDGSSEDSADQLLVIPLSATEYIAVMSPGEDALYFRAYPIRLEDMEMIQAEWLTPEADKKDDSPYFVCRYSLTNDILTVEYLNEEIVGSDIKDSALLREAVLANRKNPDLFGDVDRFRKLED